MIGMEIIAFAMHEARLKYRVNSIERLTMSLREVSASTVSYSLFSFVKLTSIIMSTDQSKGDCYG